MKNMHGGKRAGAGPKPDPLKLGRSIGVNQFTTDGLKVGLLRAMKVVVREKKKVVLEDHEGRIVLYYYDR